jgi:hypothetical protein
MGNTLEIEEWVCCENPELPDGISVSFGFAVASCSKCSYRCAYWECACELEHDCEEN